MKKLKVDVFLASHGVFFDLQGKMAKLEKGAASNPFIDPEGFRNFLLKTENDFREKLSKTAEQAK